MVFWETGGKSGKVFPRPEDSLRHNRHMHGSVHTFSYHPVSALCYLHELLRSQHLSQGLVQSHWTRWTWQVLSYRQQTFTQWLLPSVQDFAVRCSLTHTTVVPTASVLNKCPGHLETQGAHQKITGILGNRLKNLSNLLDNKANQPVAKALGIYRELME